MFEVTFVGHQGWLLRTATTAVLIDPLLTERFGHGGHVGAIYPPRSINIEAFPPIDAVILTHEHDDHFDIPSLHRLDRSIPIYLSARSSTAAHEIIATMGFDVRPLHSEQTLSIGDLRYHTVCADHRDGRGGDEWDVFPFVAYDVHGHGSLLSSVDVPLPDGMLTHARHRVPSPGLWAYALNTTNTRFQDASGPAQALPDDSDALARAAGRRLARVRDGWGTPAATLICGGGWSFDGDRAWINHHAFPLDPNRLRSALIEAHPDATVMVPEPGQTVSMQHGRRVEASPPSATGITVAPRHQWPSRQYEGDGARLGDYAPACGRRTLDPNERRALVEALDDLARALYGSPLFRQLCSVPTTSPDGEAAPAVVLCLRTSEAPLVLRYDPRACRFVECPDTGGDSSLTPTQRWWSGIECWASDLLALLRGQIGPTALCYAGRLRVWNTDPARLRISPHILWMFAHPLRRPTAAAALYRRLLDTQPDDVVRIRGRTPPHRTERSS